MEFQTLLEGCEFVEPPPKQRGPLKYVLNEVSKRPGWVALMRDVCWRKGDGSVGRTCRFVGVDRQVFLERYVAAVERGEKLCMYIHTSERGCTYVTAEGEERVAIQLQVDIDWNEGQLPSSPINAFREMVIPFHTALETVMLSMFQGERMPDPLVYTCHRKGEGGEGGASSWTKFSFHLYYPFIACDSHLRGKELVQRIKDQMGGEKGKFVDLLVYREGWMRMPGSRKMVAPGEFSPPFERLPLMDLRQGWGGLLAAEVAFPDHLDENAILLTEKEIKVKVQQRKRKRAGGSGGGGEEVVDGDQWTERVQRGLMQARVGLKEPPGVENKGRGYFYIYAAQTYPCIFNNFTPHERNQMGGWLGDVDGQLVLRLRCFDCAKTEVVFVQKRGESRLR